MTGLWQVSGRSERPRGDGPARRAVRAHPIARAERADPAADRAGRAWPSGGRLMRAGRVLVISENAPVPADRRVWNVRRSLAGGLGGDDRLPPGRATATAAVRAARGHRDPPLPAAPRRRRRSATRASTPRRCGGCAGWCAALGREQHFDIVHVCNPPDLLCSRRAPCAPGHPLCVRPPRPRARALPLALRPRRGPRLPGDARAERLAFRSPTSSLATNGSYARVAIERGGMDPEDVFVVRNGPDLARFSPVEPEPAWRRGART